MATTFQKINEITTVTTVGANDYMMLHDGNGSCKEIKCTDYQAVTPPPTEWRNMSLDNIRIPYLKSDSNTLYYDTANNAASHISDHLGIAITDRGKIVMPIMGQNFKWGATDRRYSAVTSDFLVSPLTSGKTNCNTYYTASAGNRASDTAIGFAHNYSRMINGKGIAAGEWYVPTPSEAEQIITPNISKLDYIIKTLFGTSFNFYIWTSEDCAEEFAYRYYGWTSNILSVSKTTTGIGLLLMCDMRVFQQTAS